MVNNPLKKITIAYDTLSSKISPLWVLLEGFGYYSDEAKSGSAHLETVEFIAPYSADEEAVISTSFPEVERKYTINS